MQKKRTLKLNIKLPKGVYASSEMEAKVLEAANNAIKGFASGIQAAQAAAADLQRKGFAITAEELLARRGARKTEAAAPSSTRTNQKRKARVVLSEKQKNDLIAAIKEGKETANALAKRFGCSAATVNSLKKTRGLTKSRK